MSTDKDIVRKALEDFARGDISSAFGAFDADVVWHQPGNAPVSGTHQGRQAVIEMLAELLKLGLAIDPLAIYQQDGLVYAVIDVTLGDEHAIELEIIRVDNGKLREIQHVGDTEMLERAYRK